MFGTFRLVLALMVVWYHLFDGSNLAGPVAVFGFFCLSGFLMTKIINEVYGNGLAGFGRYLINRALRIYPTYYAALIFSVVVVSLWPTVALNVGPYYTWPGDLLPTLTVVGLLPGYPSLLRPAWSLSTELVFYVLIGAALGRTRRITVIWLAVSALVPLLLLIMRAPLDFYTFSPICASLPFSIGAMIYHDRDRLSRLTPRVALLAVPALIVVGGAPAYDIKNVAWIYGALGLSALVVASLHDAPQRVLDSRLGNLAFPMFLLHDPTAVLVYASIGRNFTTSVVAVAVTLLISAVAHRLIEKPIDRLRKRVRHSSGRALTPQATA